MDKRDLETVSAAVDDELNFDQFAEWMATEDQADTSLAQQKWQNYHLIGDAMRSDLPQEFDLDLSARIMAAIEDEPAILSPQALQATAVSDAAGQTSAANLRTAVQNRSGSDVDVKNSAASVEDQATPKSAVVVPLFKKFGQYAIAASVALFTVVGVQQYQLQQQDESYSPQLNTRPIIGQVSPASLQTPSMQPLREELTEEQLHEQRKRLSAYIQDHQLQQRLNSQASE